MCETGGGTDRAAHPFFQAVNLKTSRPAPRAHRRGEQIIGAVPGKLLHMRRSRIGTEPTEVGGAAFQSHFLGVY